MAISWLFFAIFFNGGGYSLTQRWCKAYSSLNTGPGLRPNVRDAPINPKPVVATAPPKQPPPIKGKVKLASRKPINKDALAALPITTAISPAIKPKAAYSQIGHWITAVSRKTFKMIEVLMRGLRWQLSLLNGKTAIKVMPAVI